VLEIVRALALETGGPRAAHAVTPEASLDRDVGLGSLERVELSLRLEDAFGRDIEDEVLVLDNPTQLARAIREGGPNMRTRPAPPVAMGGYFADREEGLGVVSNRYQPVQNHDAFGILEPLLVARLASLETGGALRGGPQETPICVVCANTLGLALRERPRALGVRHTASVEARTTDAARQIWRGLVEAYEVVARQFRALKAHHLHTLFRSWCSTSRLRSLPSGTKPCETYQKLTIHSRKTVGPYNGSRCRVIT
jgi:acyl carrier protein